MYVEDVACVSLRIYSCSDFDFHCVTVVLLLSILMTKETHFLPLPYTFSAVQEAVVVVEATGRVAVPGRAWQCLTLHGGF